MKQEMAIHRYKIQNTRFTHEAFIVCVHPTASSRIELAIKSESNVDQFELDKMLFKKMGLTGQTKKNPFQIPGKGTE